VIKPALNYKDTSDFDQLKIGNDKTSTEFKKAYIKELKTYLDSNQNYSNVFRSIENNLMIPDSLKEDRRYEILRLGY
jgi:hypothetical protein